MAKEDDWEKKASRRVEQQTRSKKGTGEPLQEAELGC